MIYAILAVVALGLCAFIVRRLMAAGGEKEKLSQAERVLDEIHDANAARRAVKPDDADSMRRDPYNRDNGL
jgi:hypothetical protein